MSLDKEWSVTGGRRRKRKEMKDNSQGEQLVDQIESQIGFHVLGRHLVYRGNEIRVERV